MGVHQIYSTVYPSIFIFNINFCSINIGVDLSNNIIILDEAHNIERICEESASLQLKTSDVALAIEEVTAVMKMISTENLDFNDSPKDFSADDLCILKQILLDFEKEMDSIDLKKDSPEGTNFEGNFIFELLSKCGVSNIYFLFLFYFLTALIFWKHN